MRTSISFKSSRFKPTPAELDEEHEDYINPGIFGRELADYLRDRLSDYDYKVGFRCPEDWGYWQEIEHDRDYTLAVGCANYDQQGDGRTEHHVFVRPDSPTIRPVKKLFRKMDVQKDVERLVETLEKILRSDDRIVDVVVE